MGIGKYQHFSITRISRSVIYIYVRIGTCGIHNTRPAEDATAQKPKINFTLFSVLFSPTCKNNTPRAFESSCERRRIITPERTSMICYTWCIILWLLLFVPGIYLSIYGIYTYSSVARRADVNHFVHVPIYVWYILSHYIYFVSFYILPIVSILTAVQYLYISRYLPRAKWA